MSADELDIDERLRLDEELRQDFGGYLPIGVVTPALRFELGLPIVWADEAVSGDILDAGTGETTEIAGTDSNSVVKVETDKEPVVTPKFPPRPGSEAARIEQRRQQRNSRVGNPYIRRRIIAGTTAAAISLAAVGGLISNTDASANKSTNVLPSAAPTFGGSEVKATIPLILNEVSPSSESSTSVEATTTTELVIPADATTFTVRYGDTLFKIANARNMDLQTLIDLNQGQILDPNDIKEGQVVILVAPTTTVPVTEAPTTVASLPVETTPVAPPQEAPPVAEPPVMPDPSLPPNQGDGRLSTAQCRAYGGTDYNATAHTGVAIMLELLYTMPDGTPIDIHDVAHILPKVAFQALQGKYKIASIMGPNPDGTPNTECGPPIAEFWASIS